MAELKYSEILLIQNLLNKVDDSQIARILGMPEESLTGFIDSSPLLFMRAPKKDCTGKFQPKEKPQPAVVVEKPRKLTAAQQEAITQEKERLEWINIRQQRKLKKKTAFKSNLQMKQDRAAERANAKLERENLREKEKNDKKLAREQRRLDKIRVKAQMKLQKKINKAAEKSLPPPVKKPTRHWQQEDRRQAKKYLKECTVVAPRKLDLSEKVLVRLNSKTSVYASPGYDINELKLKYKIK